MSDSYSSITRSANKRQEANKTTASIGLPHGNKGVVRHHEQGAVRGRRRDGFGTKAGSQCRALLTDVAAGYKAGEGICLCVECGSVHTCFTMYLVPKLVPFD